MKNSLSTYFLHLLWADLTIMPRNFFNGVSCKLVSLTERLSPSLVADPKSASLMCPVQSSRMFSGLMSLYK